MKMARRMNHKMRTLKRRKRMMQAQERRKIVTAVQIWPEEKGMLKPVLKMRKKMMTLLIQQMRMQQLNTTGEKWTKMHLEETR